jgi:beta-glucosidase
MSTPLYKNPGVPITDRVEDLLSRMTLEEKTGQMLQICGRDCKPEDVEQLRVGSVLFALNDLAREYQEASLRTRLGIPLIFGQDCIHGHSFQPNATIFPTQLALSSSWNEAIAERVARATAVESAPTGVHWTFSPVLCMTRDIRWGRVDETFGEDPLLIGRLAAAMIRGYQGMDLTASDSILACAKHYAGYGETHGGRDASEADHSRRKMLSLFLPPFEEAVRAGCATFMVGYQAIDGVPCTADRWLLKELLRDTWGFDGFLVTDWDNVGHMVYDQHTCATYEEASRVAVRAGNDMIMTTMGFPDCAKREVEAGRLDESLLDESCRHILAMKFRMGLFENPRLPDAKKLSEVLGCPEHRALALESARESIVLLKNEGALLPIDPKKTKRIALIGPIADNAPSQLGDWSLGSAQAATGSHSRENTVTILDAMRARLGGKCEINYVKGCEVVDLEPSAIDEAVAAAHGADVAIVCLGDTISHIGERRSTAKLELTGRQQELLEAVHATGTPMVLVLMNGKPLTIVWAVEHVPAIVEAWNPGVEGGNAVLDVLLGEVNPSGKLTVSFPYHAGQQPVFYNQIPGAHGPLYVDVPTDPLFAFGYGLSYTTYEYSDFKLEKTQLRSGESLRASVRVKNAGSRAGVEIVQLYVNDCFSSVTTPVKELKAFARVALEPGEEREVRLEVPYDALSLVTPDLKRVVEPGEFEAMVGGSSRDKDLVKTKFAVV